MKVKQHISTGRAYCRGPNCCDKQIIPKGELCFQVSMNTSSNQFQATSMFCKGCMIDVFINFEAAIKNSPIYDEICMKTVLE